MSLFFKPAAPIREAHGAGATSLTPIDPDDPAFRSLGAANRDLFGMTLQRAQDLSVHLFRSNPIGHRIIRIVRSHLAGDGFAIRYHNPDVEAIGTEFWTARRNRLDRHNKPWARDFLLFGEALHPVAVDDAGNTTVGFIDPSTVDKIRRSQTNNMILETLWVRDANSAGPSTPLEIIQPSDDPFGGTAGLLTGQVHVWLLERIAAGTRGTPYLMPTLDWLDAYDQILWEMLERTKALRAFFWDAEVDGDQADVDRFLNDFGTQAPRTGSLRAHTSAVKIKAEAPNIGTGEDVAGARYQLRHIATGGGVPPHWLSDPEDANRSTAERMDLPAQANLADVQAEWVDCIEDLITHALHQKVIAGMVPAVVERHDEAGQPTGEQIPIGEAFQVVAPPACAKIKFAFQSKLH